MLFNKSNYFSVPKVSGSQYQISFDMNISTVFRDLLYVQRNDKQFLLGKAAIYNSDGIPLFGDFDKILEAARSATSRVYKFTVCDLSQKVLDYSFYMDEESLKVSITNIINADITLDKKPHLSITDNETGETRSGTVNEIYDHYFHAQIAPKNDSTMSVVLDMEEVLNEMRPIIQNGTDVEKSNAKAILAYVAAKLAKQ